MFNKVKQDIPQTSTPMKFLKNKDYFEINNLKNSSSNIKSEFRVQQDYNKHDSQKATRYVVYLSHYFFENLFLNFNIIIF